jgi:UDP-N-acetylmuramoyl-L-alanyl-D-glutamate--2,6-diaminopimelate ligase
VLTQDDDYNESTAQIIKDVLPGIERKEWENFWIIPDRESAIRTALLEAQKNDAIVIAGKWDEHVMVTNHGIVEYNDKKVVLKVLKEIDDNKVM